MKKNQRDRGRELGDRITQLFRNLFRGASTCQRRSPEKQTLLDNDRLAGYQTTQPARRNSQIPHEDDVLPAYRSTESSPRLSPQADPESGAGHSTLAQTPAPLQNKKIFTRPVIMNIMSYGILALYVSTRLQSFEHSR